MTDNPWQGKRVMITGVCGTVGGELLRQILALDVAEVVGIDVNEAEIYYLRQRMPENVHHYVCNVRDRDRLFLRAEGAQIIMHAAAYKNAPVCEDSPYETVQNNIIGTQNVIDAGIAANAERVLFNSTDKAVNPTSVMGTTKLMCERLITAANAQRRGAQPILASSRFGNVLGSSGSVIPVFARQIAAGGPVTVTDPDMTRFIMTLSEAVQLVLGAVFWAKGGEVFVTKMPVIRIEDLAIAMVEVLAPVYGHDPEEVKIEIVGHRPGEKLYEELVNEEEVRRTIELERHFVVLPALRQLYQTAVHEYEGQLPGEVTMAYNSSVEPAMSRDRLRTYLRENGLLNPETVQS
jgi:FlaA1/EpsC-like NDP-sugar epimerase